MRAHIHSSPSGGRLRAALVALAVPILLALSLSALPAAAQVALPGTGTATDTAAAPPKEETPDLAEALRLLAIVLEDPEARSALVEQLRAVEPRTAPPLPGQRAGPAAEPEPEQTVPEIIADQTIAATERAVGEIATIFNEIASVSEIVTAIPDYDFANAWTIARPVIILIAAVLGAFTLARQAYRPMLARFDRGAANAVSLFGRWRWKIAGILAEIARVFIAWTTGQIVALVMGGGEIAPAHALFLDVFLYVETIRILPRVIFRPNRAGLRILAVSGATARRWYLWTAQIIGILGYGTLFLAPLARLLDAPRSAEWITLVFVLITMLLTIGFVLRNHEPVRDMLEKKLAAIAGDGVIATWFYPLAHYWHLIVIAYTIALFVVWRAVPWDATGFMVRATLVSGLLILLGSLLVALMIRRIGGGVTLSARTRKTFPLLEARLNRFLPIMLLVVRILVAIVVIGGILTVWDIFDAVDWIDSPRGRTVVWSLGWIAGVLLLASVIYLAVASWIEYRLNPELRAVTARERTLLSLFSNAFVIALAVLTVMTVLTQLGINIAPLLAGAGVVGLAIGFGAQKLVQDIINGAFIQFENTMNEGDIVTAGPITGVVEKLTIRSVSLRDVNGVMHMIPFSSVDTVSNFSKTFSYYVADMRVAYRENLDSVKAAMDEAFERLMATEHRVNILPPFEHFGIDRFEESAFIVRGRIKTLPGQQWAVGRAFNGILKSVFDERGIQIPFPHRTLFMGVDRDGNAPPLTLRHLSQSSSGPRRNEPPASEEEDAFPAPPHDPGGAPG
ncbi:MAG TPA: mechanosensitive ion channel domain-containing protein [Paracoccaceae bacterium]|nr:mechanosensitive ion channel domain-containing protein [Paracoccaceae bacterium]